MHSRWGPSRALFLGRVSILLDGILATDQYKTAWFSCTNFNNTTQHNALAVDAVQGIKKGQAFGVALSTTKAKARFTAEHVGVASLTFGM